MTDYRDIKFGTDGWRGVIADDFTYDNVRHVGAAIASYVVKHGGQEQGIAVGYDTRFGSRRFAELVAEVLSGAGIPVRLANDYTPTPALSYAVKHLGAFGGVMITSSHNPWSWNGVKYKGGYGGSATPAIIHEIEGELYAGAWPKAAKAAAVTETDFKAAYIEAITNFADLDTIEKAGFKVCIDTMYGAGRNVLAGIFDRHGIGYLAIRDAVNPLFPGINPEPIEPHVKMCQEVVVREGCHAGFVTDGDADRIGAVAEDGSFVDAHKCFAILLKWLLDFKKWPGAVTRAFNTTGMLDRIAREYGRELIEHGIGFKYVCDVVFSGKEVLVGGEESGGIGIPRHLPERDGILNSLLLANAMADYGKPLGQLVEDLQQRYGRHYYGRRDMRVADGVKRAAIERVKTELTEFGGYKVLRKEHLDGSKLFLDVPNHNGRDAQTWILFRASGTEPLMRVYTETPSPEIAEKLLKAADAFVAETASEDAAVPAGD
jgi:phosphomannomutase